MKLSLHHVHIRSKNKITLSEWYCQNLGFNVLQDLEAAGEINGPIIISADGGMTGLSIFNSTKEPSYSFPAFSASIENFIALHSKFSQPRVYDHRHFFSIYVHDNELDKIEINCSDYHELKEYLCAQNIQFMPLTPETYTL